MFHLQWFGWLDVRDHKENSNEKDIKNNWEIQGWFNKKKEKEHLISFSDNTSNFNGLPKIHKSKLIQNVLKEQQKDYIHIQPPSFKLRVKPIFKTIVAGPICPTRSLSNLTDILLKPFLLHIKSYVKDKLDFLYLTGDVWCSQFIY